MSSCSSQGVEQTSQQAVVLRRAYPDAFEDDGFDFESGQVRLPRPLSAPASPRFTTGVVTPGEFATLTEEMQGLGTSDYMGAQQTWESLIRGKDEEEEESGHPFPLVLKRKGGPGSVSGTTSGLTTPGGTVPNGRGKSLSEHDLAQADQALSNHSTQ